MTNEEFQANFIRLKLDFEKVLKECRERDQKEAPDFNIFEILKVEREEVVHSRMLFNLLSPAGSHGQGPRFLTSFLRYCKDKIVNFPELLARALVENDRVVVVREFGSAWGRPDLAIYSKVLKFALIIEIKIDADDQTEQIPRYLKSLRDDFPFAPPQSKALVYLSLSDGGAKSSGQALSGKDYFCMSHGTHIAEWLNLVCRETLPIRVHGLLLQYLETVCSLTDEGSKAMNARNNDGEKETLDFLAKPGNFETAFEVYEKFSEVLKSLQKKFWAQVRRMIEEKVRESPAKFDGWVCLPKEKQEDQPFFDVGLAPLNRNAMSYCYLCLGQTTARDKFGLRYGIYLGIQDVKKRPPEISQAVLGLPEFETLKSYLQEKHFKVRKEEWWIGYKELERLYDPQFLNELNRYDKTDEAKLQLLVGELFSLFEQARKMMDALNIALARE